MAPTYGCQSQLGIDTANPVTVRFDFQSEDIALAEEFPDLSGLRGTRSRDVSRVRAGIRHCGGPLALTPNAVEMAKLLPWIMGGTPSGSGTVTYPLGDTAPTARYVTIDRGSKVFTYNGCQVDRATFHAAQGGALTLNLDVVGIDETVGNSGTFPALSIDTANGPWMLTDCVISINSTTVQAHEVTLTIDNQIDKERFFNSQTLVTVQPTDRHITLATALPYGDYSALYNTGAGGVAASLTFTNGGAVLTMTINKVALPRRSPFVPGRAEIMVPLSGSCYASGATKELVITENPGP